MCEGPAWCAERSGRGYECGANLGGCGRARAHIVGIALRHGNVGERTCEARLLSCMGLATRAREAAY
ncbi:unnamed protein product [Dovyalis caffra]|uniref:Appr-1-p processing enzyme family protein n=1 Tax=Dovyalis caffra TaxID=77055 RepID=A0AAV1SQL3_9ROSI|nr:unnamed protein product [Dovyalis caffra]